jgi:hypothetical protein
MMEIVKVPKVSTLKMEKAFEAERQSVEELLARGGMIFETVLAHALDAAIRAGAEEVEQDSELANDD